MEKAYKLNEDVIGSNSPDFCRKLRIYPFKHYYRGLSIDNLINKIEVGCKSTEQMKLIDTSFDEKSVTLRQFLETSIDKYNIDSFDLLHIRYGIRYPFKEAPAKTIGEELAHALSYHNREKRFLPIYSIKQNIKDDIININTYFNIYIPLYDLHNYKTINIFKNDIDSKIHYGYNVIQKTLYDPIYAIKLDSALINLIYSDARQRYMDSYKEEVDSENEKIQIKNLMDKYGISSVDELEKLLNKK